MNIKRTNDDEIVNFDSVLKGDIMGRDVKKGFTLIELLVVIAIIALLLAILMPGLSKVKKIAGGLVCRTQMKDMGVMLKLYMHDHDGRMVSNQYSADEGGTGRWTTKLGEYYERNRRDVATHDRYNTDIFFCPLEWRKNVKTGAGSYGFSPNAGYHYKINGNVADTGKRDMTNGDPWYLLKGRFAKDTKWRNPSSLPIFHDTNSDFLESAPGTGAKYPARILGEYGWNLGDPTNPNSSRFGPAANHGKGINYLFGDMHVENTLWPYKETMSSPEPEPYYRKFWHPRGDLSIPTYDRVDL
jgi:prepilin-type N-terminal cleavage/methylation domain-containing protein